MRQLTKKEIEIFELLLQGKTYLEISKELGRSFSTICSHIRNIFTKLDVNNREELKNKTDII